MLLEQHEARQHGHVGFRRARRSREEDHLGLAVEDQVNERALLVGEIVSLADGQSVVDFVTLRDTWTVVLLRY